MIVDNLTQNNNQTRTTEDRLKPTILSLCLKNKKEDKKSFQIKKSLHIEDRFLSKHHIIKMQKQTKSLLTTHKLHSLHRSYNKP